MNNIKPLFSKWTVNIAQVRYEMRPISPEDYDAAAAAFPDTCPLVLAGDRRPGRQLLAEAAVDAAQPFAAFAAGRAGRAVLDAIARRLEGADGAAAPGTALAAGSAAEAMR